MSFLSKETELLQFIESKHLTKKQIVLEEILLYFGKVIKETLKSSYVRLVDFNWTQECASIVFNIFWKTLFHTLNVKLAMFLSERAILLFNEYIDLAKITFQENSEFQINAVDVKLFIYKRTIGPLKLKKKRSNKTSHTLTKLKNVSILLKDIMIITLKHVINMRYLDNTDTSKLIENDEEYFNLHLTSYFEYNLQLYLSVFHKLAYFNLYIPSLSKYFKLNNMTDEEYFIKINIFKMDCEWIYYLYKKNKLKYEELFDKYHDKKVTLKDIIYSSNLEYVNMRKIYGKTLSNNEIKNIHESHYIKILK